MEPTATAEPVISNTYTRLLDQIPDLSETRAGVYLTDYSLAASLIGIAAPGENASNEAVLEYISTYYKPPMRIVNPAFASGMDVTYGVRFIENAPYRGYDQRQVTASATAGEMPSTFEVVFGQFDPAAFAVAIECADCAPAQVMDRDGISWFSWNEEYEQDLRSRNSPPVFDYLGRGGNWLVEDGTVLRTIARDDMQKIVDTKSGSRSSLGDRNDFVLLANAMFDMNAYSIYISTKTMQKSFDLYVDPGGYGLSPEVEATARAWIDKLPALRPYSTYALGSGIDEEGQYTAVAFVHASEQDAKDSAILLKRVVRVLTRILDQRVWSETFDSVETETDGVVMKAKLRESQQAPIWGQILDNGEPLFAHE